MPHYRYDALNAELGEIRLLKLLPGEFSSEIYLQLITQPLTETVQLRYDALSYTWGSTQTSALVFVGENTLDITQSLAEALPYLRYPDKSRVLWIDAMCINQRDIVERSQQVKRMAMIYSKAERVVVWLGLESNDTPSRIGML
jgi:hypothetical protein